MLGYESTVKANAMKMLINFVLISVLASGLWSVSLGCNARSIPPEERDVVRAEIDQKAVEIVEAMKARHPQLRADLETAVGFFAARISSTQVVFVGGGIGLGVLVDSADETQTYMNVRRIDVGVGLGGGR
jgi:hypothetical protein